MNGATCNDQIESFECICAFGFNGTMCEMQIEGCESSPCENGGTCINGVGNYSCECPTGYNGTNCEIELGECTSNPCHNNGTCVVVLDQQNCSCTTEWKGELCEIRILNEPICLSMNGIWYSNTGQCFQYNLLEKTWKDSYCHCESSALSGLRGKLAVPQSEDVLNYLMNVSQENNIWIGIRTKQIPHTNTTMFMSEWFQYEEDISHNRTVPWFNSVSFPSGTKEDCIYASGEVYYADYCDGISTKPYFCEFVEGFVPVKISDYCNIPDNTTQALPTTFLTTNTTTITTTFTNTTANATITKTEATTNVTTTINTTITITATTANTTTTAIANTTTVNMTATLNTTMLMMRTSTTATTTNISTTTIEPLTLCSTTAVTFLSTNTNAEISVTSATLSATNTTVSTKIIEVPVGATTNASSYSTQECWTPWSMWTQCTSSCGGGIQNRSREAAEQGTLCVDGDYSEEQNCNEQQCKDCEWNEWGQWGSCSVSCGNGTLTSYRSILHKGTSEGKKCEGSNMKTMLCSGTCIVPTVPPALDFVLEQSGLDLDVQSDSGAVAATIQDSSPFILATFDPEIKATLGHKHEEIVPLSLYDGKTINESDWQQFHSSTYGSCYTFNRENPPKFTTYRAGIDYGLMILLQSSQSDYMCSTQSAGFRVVIHNSTEYPFPETAGTYVSPGTSVNIGITRTEIKRLAPPYGDCVTNDDVEYHYPGVYTVEGCLRSCFQTAAMKSCSCGDPRMPLPKNTSTEYCGIKKKECLDYKRECESNLADSNKCVCKQPCIETLFSQVSSLSFLKKNDIIYYICRKQSKTGDEARDCLKTFKKNYALVRIYYEATNSIIFSEKPAYGLEQMLSDFGGVGSIILGASAITLVEFVFAALDLLIFTITDEKHTLYLS